MSHFSFLLGLIEHFLQIMSRHSFPAGLIEDSFIVMSPQQHYMGHTVIFSLYVPTDLIYGTFLIFAPHMSHFPILSGHFLHFFCICPRCQTLPIANMYYLKFLIQSLVRFRTFIKIFLILQIRIIIDRLHQ